MRINVITGQSTNAWISEHLHLDPLFDPDFNPTGALPEAYGIAPYFGANGLNGNDPDIWEKLNEDIFIQRPEGSDNAGGDSRIEDIRDQHEVASRYGIELIAYEGGQHITKSAAEVNRDPRMYEIYIDYLDAVSEYLTVFAHYVHVANCKNSGAWGAKEYTGQSPNEAHKYRALRDWADQHRDHQDQTTQP